MNILITGGFGYLGLHLSKHLSGMGHHVRVFDKFVDNSLEFRDVMRGDITKLDDCRIACEDMDLVLHLAGLSTIISFIFIEFVSVYTFLLL